jgi:hypothetical protein
VSGLGAATVAEFVERVRQRRLDAGLSPKIANSTVYALLDGLLAAEGKGSRGVTDEAD